VRLVLPVPADRPAPGLIVRRRRTPLTAARILAWADAHRARTGGWPTLNSGAVRGARGERWRDLDRSLRQGYRGLPGGDSLSRLLARERGVGTGGWRPWTAGEDALVRALRPAEAAKRTGRALGAVYQRRWVLGLCRRQRRSG
jgi:hypothetical protein